MQSSKLAGPKPGVAAQKFVDIAEVRDDTLILKDGTLRAVLLVSSINFSLKSYDEQQAIVQAYMQFLNSLEFPIQIVIQSRKMDIDPYMRQLSEQEKILSNDLLKRQISDYQEFIKKLVQMGEIMQKRFYVVVPLNPATNQQKNFFKRLGEILTPTIAIRFSAERFQKQQFDLSLRVNQIIGGLSSMSLKAVQLNTQSLIELFYTIYNPELYDTERLTEIDKIQIESA